MKMPWICKFFMTEPGNDSSAFWIQSFIMKHVKILNYFYSQSKNLKLSGFPSAGYSQLASILNSLFVAVIWNLNLITMGLEMVSSRKQILVVKNNTIAWLNFSSWIFLMQQNFYHMFCSSPYCKFFLKMHVQTVLIEHGPSLIQKPIQ